MRHIAWYVAHPVTADEYPWLTDAFDYETEDRLIAGYEAAMAELELRAPPRRLFIHPYAHPREPGTQLDHRTR